MIVAPQQKRFAADAKAALHMRGITAKSLAAQLGVHPSSVYDAISSGRNRRVLLGVCKILELQPPTE